MVPDTKEACAVVTNILMAIRMMMFQSRGRKPKGKIQWK